MRNINLKLFIVVLICEFFNIYALEEDFSEFRYMNISVDPCEDFFEYTCGNFKNIYPLTEGVSTIDHFTILTNELTNLSRLILSEPIDSDDPQAIQKTKSAFQACIDLNYLASVKNPELRIIQELNGFPMIQQKSLQDATNYSFYDVADAVGKYGIPMFFKIQAYGNPGNSTNNLIYISALDAASLTPSQIRAEHETTYEQLMENSFSMLRESKRRSKRSLRPFDIFLRNISLKLRTASNSILKDDEVFDNLDVVAGFTRGVFTGGYLKNMTVEKITENNQYSVSLKLLNEWTQRQFNFTLELDWIQFLQRVFSHSGIQITEETQVMTYLGLEQLLCGIFNMVRSTEDHIVKSFVMLRIFTHLAPDSDDESRQYFEQYMTSMNVPILPRWEYCTRKLIDSLDTASISFAVAYEYQLRYFNVNSFGKTLKLLKYLQQSFRELLETSSWLDEQSKKKAIKKFDNMITILGHPDLSYDRDALDTFYENLTISKWDNFGNSIQLKAFKSTYQLSQVGNRDRSFWEKSPFEVNAYYNPPNNKIIFPIAMLHSIFFGNKNEIVDYARIGSIIGHEMTHGFDSTGMNYNADGVMEPWWSNETANAFKLKANCFIEEYNQFYEPEIHKYINGTTTINENIADNGGLREAYRAMKKMLKRQKTVANYETNSFSAEQLFFIGFGTMWCNNPSTDYLQKMHGDQHCRSKFRVNGVVSNMKEFSEAFNCSVESAMNPSKKCILW